MSPKIDRAGAKLFSSILQVFDLSQADAGALAQEIRQGTVSFPSEPLMICGNEQGYAARVLQRWLSGLPPYWRRRLAETIRVTYAMFIKTPDYPLGYFYADKV